MQVLWGIATVLVVCGLERPGVEYRVFQFPPDKIPRIDGQADDWSIVPESYAIGMDQLRETVVGLGDRRDPADLDVKVKVGWVKGQNQLYFRLIRQYRARKLSQHNVVWAKELTFTPQARISSHGSPGS